MLTVVAKNIHQGADRIRTGTAAWIITDRGIQGDVHNLFHDLDDVLFIGRKLFHGHGLGVIATVQHQSPFETIHQSELVGRDTHRPHLFKKGFLDRLADPPNGIGNELDILVHVKTLGCLVKTDIAFINQIQQGQSSPLVLAGDRDHKAKVTPNEPLEGRFTNFLRFAGPDNRQQGLFLLLRKSRVTIQVAKIK